MERCRVADPLPAIADPTFGNCRSRFRQLPAARQRSATDFVKWLIMLDFPLPTRLETRYTKSLESLSCRLPVSLRESGSPGKTPLSKKGRQGSGWLWSPGTATPQATLQSIARSLLAALR
jgi:hypothetical protein